jgi:para-nitrobenzyl esterase
MNARRVFGAVFAALVACVAGLPAHAEPGSAPVVQTASGPVRGMSLPDGRAVFQGIPFAAPPVGALRWRPPEPASPWTEVRAATDAGPACPQPDLGWNHADAVRESEDCLYLDVATPDLRPDARLPVMVWIHGGANWAGSGRGTVFSKLTQRGVVMVAFEYRLGVLGFLSHPALTAEQGGASGNYALMDQVAALAWIKANIARFGGDPGRVTIFGESAGAMDVGLLNLIPSADGLFARSIQESGTAGFGLPPRSLAENEGIGVQLAEAAGSPSGPGALAALRALTPEQVIAAQKQLHAPRDVPDDSFIWLQAVTDGRVLPKEPALMLAQMRASGRRLRPLLVGSNAKEIDFIGGPDPRPEVLRIWGAPGLEALATFGAAADPRFGAPALQAATDGMFRCPATFTAMAVEASGSASWLYLFDVPNSGGTVSHNSELSFVFDDLPTGAPGVKMQAYWANFARSGDPNGEGLPVWPRYGADRGYIDFETGGPSVEHVSRTGVCDRLGRP